MAAEQSAGTKSRVASVGEIADFWELRQPTLLIAVPWSQACEKCWRCGEAGPLDRCHIVPASRGGSGDPLNLILLCPRCHRDAPNVADQRFMLSWLEVTAEDGYWHEQSVALFRRIYGRDPFSRLGKEPDADQQRAALKRAATIVSTHLGDGWWNTSTTCAMFEIAEELMLA